MKSVFLIFSLVLVTHAFGAKPLTEPTQLDDLLRGEQAALKAYDQALRDVKDPKQRTTLQMLRKDHEAAMTTLSKYVEGKPSLLTDTEEAGPWGTFSAAWIKTRSFTGNDGAIKALKQGEEYGVGEYKDALEDESLSAGLKKAIRTELLPRQQKHLNSLNGLM